MTKRNKDKIVYEQNGTRDKLDLGQNGTSDKTVLGTKWFANKNTGTIVMETKWHLIQQSSFRSNLKLGQ